MRTGSRIGVVTAAMALSACMGLGGGDAEPVTWYRLALSPRAFEGPRLPMTLALRTFSMSESLAPEGIAFATSDVECGYWTNHRWAEPVAELVRQAVQADLEPTGLFRAVFLADNAGSADLLLTAEVHRFGERDRPDGWYAEADVTFETLRARDGIVVYHRRMALEERCDGPWVREVANALSRAVSKMCDVLRADLSLVAPAEEER
ncbi:MAG: ABC-type transport auxiliary lipoprotein family protein [Planctomycetes bacterium]|nr:ABC-type transport auxiliary lipoprotein family protein [Planctomycetota bacterium]